MEGELRESGEAQTEGLAALYLGRSIESHDNANRAFILAREKHKILEEFGLIASKSSRSPAQSSKRPRPRDLAELENGWIGAAIPVSEQNIPPYDARADPYCPFTRMSDNFKKSPFMQMLRDKEEMLSTTGMKWTVDHPIQSQHTEQTVQCSQVEALSTTPHFLEEASGEEQSPTDEVVQAIEARELLMRTVVSPKFESHMTEEMVKTLRAASLRVVETISAWNRAKQSAGDCLKEPFIWQSINYLLKMTIDTDYLLRTSPTFERALPSDYPRQRNPFLLKHSLDDFSKLVVPPLAQEDSDDSVLHGLELLRLRRAARLIVSEEATRPEDQARVNAFMPQSHTQHATPSNMSDSQLQKVSDQRARVKRKPILHPSPPQLPLAELEALAKLKRPPMSVVLAFACARVLLSQNIQILPDLTSIQPRALRAMLRKPKVLLRQLKEFSLTTPLRPLVVRVLHPVLGNPRLSVMEIQRHSPCAAALFAWVKKVVLKHLKRLDIAAPTQMSDRQTLSLQTSPLKSPQKVSFMGDSNLVDAFADVEEDESGHGTAKGMMDRISGDVLSQLRQEIDILKQELAETQDRQHPDINREKSAREWGAATTKPTQSRFLIGTDTIRRALPKASSDAPDVSRELTVRFYCVSKENASTAMEIEATDTSRDDVTETHLVHVPAFLCDRLVSLSPMELLDLSESDRKLKLTPLIHALRFGKPVTIAPRWGAKELREFSWKKPLVDEVPWGREKNTDSDQLIILESDGYELTLQTDRMILRKVHSLSGRQYNLRAFRDEQDNGIHVVAWPMLSRAWKECLHLFIPDAETELLLIAHPALFNRIMFKWSALTSTTEWLVQRLRLQLTNRDKGVEHDRLVMLRSIHLPQFLSTGWSVNDHSSSKRGQVHSQDYHLKMKQVQSSVVISAIPVPDPNSLGYTKYLEFSKQSEEMGDIDFSLRDDEIDATTEDDLSHAHPCHVTDAHLPQPLSLSLTEVQAFIGPIHRTKDTLTQEQLEEGDSSSPLTRLLARISIVREDSAKELSLSSLVERVEDETPALADESLEDMDESDWLKEQRKVIAKAPKNLSIWAERTLLTDTREISQVPCKVEVELHGDDLVFKVTTLGPLPHIQREPSSEFSSTMKLTSSPSASYALLSRVVSPAEAKEILQKKLCKPLPQILSLLDPRHRQELCRELLPQLLIAMEKSADGTPTSKLETSLYSRTTTLTIAVDKNTKPHFIGSLEVSDQTTLAELRDRLSVELDEEDVPQSFRFEFVGAPCARRQEGFRLAIACAPVVVLLSREVKKENIKKGRKRAEVELFDGEEIEEGRNIRQQAVDQQTAQAIAETSSHGGEDEALEAENEMTDVTPSRRSRRKKHDDDTVQSPSETEEPSSRTRRSTRTERMERMRKKNLRRDGPKVAQRRKVKEKEPQREEAVQFVPYPLPSLVCVVQGSDEIWARSLVNLNDMLTGDDILRVGTVDSADYPVAPRPDDIIRKRKPRPPPWWLRPDVLEARERAKTNPAVLTELEKEELVDETELLAIEAQIEAENANRMSLDEAERRMEAAIERFLEGEEEAVAEMERLDEYIQTHPDYQSTLEGLSTTEAQSVVEGHKDEGNANQEEQAEIEFERAEPVDLLTEISTSFFNRLTSPTWFEFMRLCAMERITMNARRFPRKEALDEVIDIIGEPAKLVRGDYKEFARYVCQQIHHNHSLVNNAALEIIRLLARGLRGAFFECVDGAEVLRHVVLRLKDRLMSEHVQNTLNSFFPLAIPLGKLLKLLPEYLDPTDEKNNAFTRIGIYEFLTRCVERSIDAELEVNGKGVLTTKMKLAVMNLAIKGLNDLPEQTRNLLEAICCSPGFQGVSNKERYELRVITSFIDRMPDEHLDVAESLHSVLVEGVKEVMQGDVWANDELRAPWWMPGGHSLAEERKRIIEQKRLKAAADAKEPPQVTADRMDHELKVLKRKLELAVMARDFEECADIHRAIEQLKIDRQNIPGLSIQDDAALRIQCFVRVILAKQCVKLAKFRRKLPPKPWQTHVDPDSSLKYYWNPYTNKSTWEIDETGEELRKKEKEREERRRAKQLPHDMEDSEEDETSDESSSESESSSDEDEEKALQRHKKEQEKVVAQIAEQAEIDVRQGKDVSLKAPEEVQTVLGRQSNGFDDRPIEWPKRPRSMIGVKLGIPYDRTLAKKLADKKDEEEREKLESQLREVEASLESGADLTEQKGKLMTQTQKKKAAAAQDNFFARMAGGGGREDSQKPDSDSQPPQTEDEIEPDEGTLFANLPVWRLIPKDQDSRPSWRFEFDCGRVPFEFEHTESRKIEEQFHVKLWWKDLERAVVDDWKILIDDGTNFKAKPLHEQRINYFLSVPSDKIIEFAFSSICQWFPQSDGVDSAKWAKFCRDMRLFPDIHKPKRAAQVDLAFKRNFTKQEEAKDTKTKRKEATRGASKAIRRLNVEFFRKALAELVMLRYPRMVGEPELAMKHVLMEQIVMMPEINAKCWNEAKRLAMLQEAVRQGAVIRLQSLHRKLSQMEVYRHHLRCAVLIQALMRRSRCVMRYKRRRAYLFNDLIFRMRWIAAIMIQKTFRGFLNLKYFREKVQRFHEEYMIRCRQRRSKQAARRKRREKACVFKRVRTVNGCMCLQEMFKRSTSRIADSDVGMIIRVYVPANQRSFRFDISDSQVRAFLQQSMGTTATLSNNEILEKRCLSLLCDRLMCRVIEGQPIIYISRRTIGERGIQIARKGINISGNRVVVTVFWANDEIVFQTYDTRNCGPMRTTITIQTLREWLASEALWEKKRARRKLEADRGEARKTLRKEKLGLPMDDETLERARDFLAKTGGCEEFDIDAIYNEDQQVKEKSRIKKNTDEIGLGNGVTQGMTVREMKHGKDLSTEKPIADSTEPVADQEGLSQRVEDITDNQGYMHPLLMESNREKLIAWLFTKLRIATFKQGQLRGKPLLTMQYELDIDAQHEAAAKIQGLHRIVNARYRVRRLTLKLFEKRYMRDYTPYYVFLPTGYEQWTKPKCLFHTGIEEEMDDPPDEWREVENEDGVYYMNPFTGQTSWISPEEAAKVIQKCVREYQAAEIGKPTITEMIKAVRIERDAEEKYDRFPDRLSSIVNWAMVLHTIHRNYEQARKLYKRAMEISPENPVLLRAYGLFLLAVCEPPRALSWSRALDYIKTAEVRDPTREKFHVAEESMFHWAVVCQPKNAQTLLNYALLQQCVVKDFDLAEKFYRRAIACNPDDHALVKNFQDFQENRLPGGLYAGGGPPRSVLQTSSVHKSKPDWAEWKLMKNNRASDTKFELYWHNSVVELNQWQEPDWEKVWSTRLDRSTLVNNFGLWQEFYDPALESSFYMNVDTKRFQAANPFGEANAP